MRRTTLLGRGLLVALAAVLGNAVLWVVVKVAGVDPQIIAPGTSDRQDLALPPVVIATFLGGAVGAGLLALTWGRIPRLVTVMQVVGGVLTLLSLVSPLGLDVPTSSKVVLCLMHLLVGAVVVGGLTLVARRAGAGTGRSSVGAGTR